MLFMRSKYIGPYCYTL